MLLTINLLPWRIARKEKQKKLFQMVFILTLLVNLIAMVGIGRFLAYSLKIEKEKINYLSSVITEYGSLEKEYKDMQQDKAALISRLQERSYFFMNQKQQTAFLKAIVDIDGSYVNFKEISKQDKSIVVSGQANSYKEVDSLMRQMKNLRIFSHENLQEMQSYDSKDKENWHFVLTMGLKA